MTMSSLTTFLREKYGYILGFVGIEAGIYYFNGTKVTLNTSGTIFSAVAGTPVPAAGSLPSEVFGMSTRQDSFALAGLSPGVSPVQISCR